MTRPIVLAALAAGAIALSGCQPASQEMLPDPALLVAPTESELPSQPSEDPLRVINPADDSAPEIDPTRVEGPTREVIEAYLALTDRIGQQGGQGAEQMAQIVTEEWLGTELEAFADYQNRAIRTIGVTTFDHFAIQSVRITADGQVEVAAFVCVDSTQVWVVDQASPPPPEDLVEWLGAGADRVEPSDERYEQWSAYLDDVKPVSGYREPIVIWLIGPTAENLAIDATDNWWGNHPCELTP